ncbi:hypothetical protein NGF75_08485 [Dietzia kunjamensis]|uniref:hypothetical protein n=1 Tax=Dietzia kunjamensis TaxID=322509 RepID=UPI002DBB718C|nr:hypothetical protein [Dietzia kunjamensis]MEB8326023.1 hypothetical protein [Dietzia kunjamensis]
MTATFSEPTTAQEWEQASTHRTPGIDIKPLVSRDKKGESFEFNIVRFGGEDFWSPRHRHNFDQIRIGLEGETRYGKGALKPRHIGYFPESTWYGPLSVAEPSIQGILQLDGPSRCGYITYNHLDPATEQLKQEGNFEGGFWVSATGEKIDGFQASWERATGKKMVYPTRRFTEPFYMDLDAFAWLEQANGVAHKLIGEFNERGTRIEMLRLDAGATAQIGTAGRSVVAFTLTGDVAVDGQNLSRWSAALIEDQAITVSGEDAHSELILITMPHFDA